MPTRREFLKYSGAATAGVFLLDPSQNSAYASNENVPDQESNLRFRQVHLDFHTSEWVKDIGKDFDPEKFAQRLVKANVNSVTVFAKCCHGHFYYDSQLYPDLVHPELKNRNLLKDQIEACHKYGIRTPIYTVIQWDTKQTHKHADWLVLDVKGNPTGTPQNEAGFMRNLCVNTPYSDFTASYMNEIQSTLPVDGWFIDIVMEKPCFCPYCSEGMKQDGFNPRSFGDGVLYSRKMFKAWKAKMTKLILDRNPKATIKYNTGHIGPYVRSSKDSYTHFELESLPSGAGWGYMHFPITARYARNLGKDMLGMTGKFHTAWGDFHSLKNKAALQAEVFTMLALNARCSIGDQLHPYGVLDEATYNLIGDVYEQVKQREPWCIDAAPVCEIAVWNAEEYADVSENERVPVQNIGIARMLQEGKHQFDFVDAEMDFTKYKILILPDCIVLNDEMAKKVRSFLSGGGKVIASHRSLLNLERTQFMIDTGADYVGAAPFEPDFIQATPTLRADLPDAPLVMYLKGMEVKVTDGRILADTYRPFFNRTPEHFFSHLHAPIAARTHYPGIIEKGGVIYFSHPIFEQYAKNAPLWCKRLLLAVIDRQLGVPIVATPNAPSGLTVTINQQAAKRRYVLHALFYVPERRGNDFDVIEDIIELRDVRFEVAIKGITKVELVPEMKTVSHRSTSKGVTFTIGSIKGNQMLALHY